MMRPADQYGSRCMITVVIVCFLPILVSCLILTLFREAAAKNSRYPEPAIKSRQVSTGKGMAVPQEVTLPLKEMAADVKNISSQITERGKYSFLLGFGPWFTGIVALFLGLNIINYLRRPRLKVQFEKNKIEYAHKLLFDKIPPRLRDPLTNRKYDLRQPGFNSRVKVINKGRTVARNVQARIESVKCHDKLKVLKHQIYYHPSAVKWSGEKEYNKIDIAPHAGYFFLDLVYSINETHSEIFDYHRHLGEDILTGLIGDQEDYSNKVYWAVWVDRSYPRGIPEIYEDEGYFELNYLITAENCKPKRFTACMQWEKSAWNNPEIWIGRGC